MQEYTLEWAEMLSFSKLKGTIEDPNYVFTIDLIRSACDHSFDIASNANCRVPVRPMVICQLKPLEWSYLYRCIKLSKKDFYIFLPDNIKAFGGEKQVYAWYNKKIDAIECFAYTGNFETEEDCYGGYDGFGRFDKEYEIIQGAIDKKGHWTVKPYKAFTSLYTMPSLKPVDKKK